MFNLGPFDLSNANNQPVRFNPGANDANGTAQPLIGVLLQNLSGSYINIISGALTTAIAPFSAFPIKYSGPTLTPSQVEISTPSAIAGQVLVTVFQKGDDFPNISIQPSATAVDINAGTVQVENVVNGVLQTYAKSPPAIGTITQSSNGGTGSTSNVGYSYFPVSVSVTSQPGNLVLLMFAVYSNNSGFQAGTWSLVPPAGTPWVLANSSFVVPSGITSSNAALVFMCYCTSAGNINGTWQIQAPNTTQGGEGVEYTWVALSFGSGSSNAFSNGSLTGASSANTSWSANGASNANLNLATQGLWVMSIGATNATQPTFSVGTEYVSYSSYTADTGGLWIASGQVGELLVDTSSNPADSTNRTNIFGETGLVIPQ